MDELIKLLDSGLSLVKYEIAGDIIKLYVASEKTELKCPYCNTISTRIHSYYDRSFQDLPIQGKKTLIFITNRKMFCNNSECSHTTFAEQFDFIEYKAKKSKRLKEEIIRVSLNQSSVSASDYLNKSVADVKKSTICSYLKKIRGNT